MIIITKENKKHFNIPGTFVVVGLDNAPILKNNGQPWSGTTKSMSNYYGIIVGAGKYKDVKTSATWDPSYRIQFIPNNHEPGGENEEKQIEGENTVMATLEATFKHEGKTAPIYIDIESEDEEDIYVTCQLGENTEAWKKIWFSDIEDWKKFHKAANRLYDLQIQLEKAIVKAMPSKYKFDPETVIWNKVLTEGCFALRLIK